MSELLSSGWQLNIELSLLLLAILLARYLIRKTTKNYNAYLLWLSIPLGLLAAKLITSIDFSEPPTQAVTYLVGEYVVKPAELFDRVTLLGYLWLMVSELLLLRLLWQHIDLRRSLSLITVNKATKIISKYPVIVINKEGFSPAVYGFFRPQIYFPQHLFKQLTDEQVKLIIKHEEEHIKQKHLWLNLLWDVLVCLAWFNPLIYISRQNFRHDQELFCDYLVLNKSTKQEHNSYGHALLSTVSATHSVSLLCSWKMFNQLEERIMNIKKPTSLSSKLSMLLGGVAIIGCTSLYAIGLAEFSEQSNRESLSHTTTDNGDEKIRWQVNGKSYVKDNERHYIVDGSQEREMTNAERLEFEKAVERSQKELKRSERELRLAEKEIERVERDMALAEKQIERAHAEMERNQEDIMRAQEDVERAHQDMQRAFSEGGTSKEELHRVQESLHRAQEQMKRDQERSRLDMERARKDIERARQQLEHHQSLRTPPMPSKAQMPPKPQEPRWIVREEQSDIPMPPKPARVLRGQASEIPLPAVPVSPEKPVAPARSEKPVAPAAAIQSTVSPSYPENAAANDVQGYVTFVFDIQEDGTPENIKVIQSEPENVFEQAALDSLKQWKFNPQKGGSKNVTYTMEFALE